MRIVVRAMFPTALVVVALLPVALGAQRTRSGGQAFAIEAAGATAGSLAAVIAAHQIANRTHGVCPVEDLGCLIKRIGIMGASSAVGAAGGGYLAGRVGRTRPSGTGSALGGIAGVAIGAGALHVLGETLDIHNRPTAALAYAVVQGLSTALVSRAMARH